jgi:site-specific DNA-methyltransferase (adenine-specific)
METQPVREQDFEHGIIYEGDCLELMQDIPDSSIDMILADLPYGTTQNKWDVVIPFAPLWEQYERIIKQNGAIVLTAAEPFTSFLVVSNHKLFRYDLVWEKSIATGFLNSNRMPLRGHENILVFYKSLPVYHPQKFMLTTPSFKNEKYRQKRNGNYGEFSPIKESGSKDGSRLPRSVFSVKTESDFFNSTKSGLTIHSTQKPVALFEYLIRTYTNEGDTVLDNVIGSGTTAVAAFRTGRRWIGMEKDSEIFEKACQRIEKDTRQQNLFSMGDERSNNRMDRTKTAGRDSQ